MDPKKTVKWKGSNRGQLPDDVQFDTKVTSPAGSFTTSVTSPKVDVGALGRLILGPGFTTTQKNALTGVAEGTVVYDTTLNKLCFYTGAAWETVTSA